MIEYSGQRLARSLLLGMLLCAAVGEARSEILVTLLIDANYPPYAYRTADGEAAGIYADILRATEPRLHGYRLKLQPTPWRRALAEVEAGRALAVVPPAMRPRERPYIGRYSAPLLVERVTVFCRQSLFANRARKQWPDDFQGLRFGTNLGSLAAGEAFWQAARSGLIEVEEAPGTRSNLLKMLRGRIDCFVFDRISVLANLSRMRREGLYDESKGEGIAEGPTLNLDTAHVGFSNRDQGRFPFKEDFASQLDTALETLRRSGEIERIVKRYTD